MKRYILAGAAGAVAGGIAPVARATGAIPKQMDAMAAH